MTCYIAMHSKPKPLDLTPLEQFLDQRHPNNAWLALGSYRAYVRKGYHLVPNRGACHTLDLASIITECEVYAGFWRLFAELQRAGRRHGFDYLWLENTHNERLLQAYVQRGATVIPNTHNLYKALL